MINERLINGTVALKWRAISHVQIRRLRHNLGSFARLVV